MATEVTEPRRPEAPRPTDPTIGKLVNDALADVQTLVRGEIALAKSEIAFDAKKAGMAIGMFAGAGVVGLFGLGFLLHTIAVALIAVGLAPWLAYLIVTLVLLVIAGVLALLGKSALTKVKGKPERTIDSTKETLDTIKRSASGETTSSVRRADPLAHGATGSSTATTAMPVRQQDQRTN